MALSGERMIIPATFFGLQNNCLTLNQPDRSFLENSGTFFVLEVREIPSEYHASPYSSSALTALQIVTRELAGKYGDRTGQEGNMPSAYSNYLISFSDMKYASTRAPAVPRSDMIILNSPSEAG